MLLTHDGDFANIVQFPPRKHSGIIILRIHPPRLSSLVDALERLLGKQSAKKLHGRTFILRVDSYLEQC